MIKKSYKSELQITDRTLKGYASIFNVIDADNDRILQGAFEDNIKDYSRLKYLAQHDINKPLGIIKTLIEDSKGLYFETEIAKTSYGNDMLTLVKDGVLNENSIGILDFEAKENFELKCQDIYKCNIYEISLVTLASNEYAKLKDKHFYEKCQRNKKNKEKRRNLIVNKFINFLNQ